MSNRTRKVVGVKPAAGEDMKQAIAMVTMQKAEAEAAQALESIQAKYGVVFQFEIGGIKLKATVS